MDARRARAGRYARAGARWARLLASGAPSAGVRVFYGWDEIPAPGEPVRGPTAKIQRLSGRFPSHPTGFTLLYLASNWLPPDLRALLALARRRRIPVVVNQDGVGYPGWAGERTEEVNGPLRRALHAADHVLYQSDFSKRSADVFLGEPSGTWEVLSNAVDVNEFRPAGSRPTPRPTLLLGGDQTQVYRLELALRTLRALLPRRPEARLLVTGSLARSAEPMLRELGLEGRVELLGRYAQRDAPDVYRRADLLLHTKVNDSCPSVVIEALACGLPVVYAASGGTVELVGDEAGVGVPHPHGWERDEPPTPEAMADAVERVLSDLPRYSASARARAVERFSLEPWLERHAELFPDLLERVRGERAASLR